jgi:hypothetical protein
MTAASPAQPSLDRNWALVAAGALMTCVAIGVVFSLAVFLDRSVRTRAGRVPASRPP